MMGKITILIICVDDIIVIEDDIEKTEKPNCGTSGATNSPKSNCL